MQQRAFSLVELSIVLVILGLLVGGILSGQSLIRAAELRSVSTEYQRYATAIQTFRDKYFALPGDMTNATNFWGAAHATPATCVTTLGTGTQTCNGDGDSYIAGATCNERHRFWQQLANAGLIEGQYSGIAGASGVCHTTLATTPPNAPRSKLTNAGWSIATGAGMMLSGHHSYFDGFYGDRFFFGGQNDTLASSTWAAALRAEEAWNIDTKVDDGQPAYGKVQTYKNGATWGTPNCATTNASATAAYAISTTTTACALMFQAY